VLRTRLLAYFRDTAEGEPGGAEADPLQARPGSAGVVMVCVGRAGADVLILRLLRVCSAGAVA
jgi:hypothetical protein